MDFLAYLETCYRLYHFQLDLTPHKNYPTWILYIQS